MPWPAASQKVLFALATVLFGLGLVLGVGSARAPFAISVADDPVLDVRLDPNTATTEELETLPGIGVALAGRVVAYRSEHGPFHSVDELRRVSGLGDKLVNALRPLLSVR